MLAIAAIAAFSCTKEKVENDSKTNNLSPITIQACSEGSVKVAFSTESYPSIVWTGTESISVLGTNTGNQTFTTESTGASAEFSGLADLTDDNLYAVYPANNAIALNAGVTTTLSNVTIPATQTAVEGSFDPKAFVAVASTTSEEKSFSFKSVVSLLKFRLEDVASVEKVIFTGNNDEIMAGTASSINLDGTLADDYTDESKSITVTGPFTSGKDYFAATLPHLFDKGLTIYVQYSDGTVKSCKISSQLFEEGKTRNCIRNLNTIPSAKLKVVTDLYALYNVGADVTVGRVTVNKTSYPTVNYICATSTDKTLKTGVNFVNSDVVAELPTGGIALPFIVAGNTEGARTTLNAASQIKFVSSATVENNVVEFQNVSLSTENITEGYLLANTQDNTMERIGLNNCRVDIIGDKNLSYMLSARNLNCFIVKDCDIKANSTKAVYLMQIQANEFTMTELTITNNVFWSDDAVKGFSVFHNRKSTVNKVNITQNTFVNVYPQASYAYCQLDNLISGSVSNNLFYFEDYTTNCTDTYTGIVKAETKPTDTAALVPYDNSLQNYAVYNSSSIPTKKMKVAQNINNGQIYNKTKADASEVFDFTDDSENFNISKGIFKSKKAAYGAHRQ